MDGCSSCRDAASLPLPAGCPTCTPARTPLAQACTHPSWREVGHESEEEMFMEVRRTWRGGLPQAQDSGCPILGGLPALALLSHPSQAPKPWPALQVDLYLDRLVGLMR